MLAKVCSDMNKPNGQSTVESDSELIKAFMACLPIRKIPGIGKVESLFLASLTLSGFLMSGVAAELEGVRRSLDLNE